MTFRSGHMRDYDLFLANDVVTVINEQVIITKQSVRGLSDFVNKAKELKLGFRGLKRRRPLSRAAAAHCQPRGRRPAQGRCRLRAGARRAGRPPRLSTGR